MNRNEKSRTYATLHETQILLRATNELLVFYLFERYLFHKNWKKALNQL
jgi:hypothetical protein